MFAVGCGGAILTTVLSIGALRSSGSLATAAISATAVSTLAALYGFGMAAYMTYASKVGKGRTRERLLDLAQTLMPWTGRETVLDVGCGRGLMLIGAARRLTTGQAIGIDLWRAEDQTDNGPTAALDNARREGVADRVCVETGDARALPFADAAFDVVLSHWVVHNLPSTASREQALREMLRVLRPGGTLVLSDIAHHATYRTILLAAGLCDLREETGGAQSRIIGVLSGLSFRPQALVGLKPR